MNATQNTPDNCEVFASQSERFPESYLRFHGFPLVSGIIQGQYHEAIAGRIELACNSFATLSAHNRELVAEMEKAAAYLEALESEYAKSGVSGVPTHISKGLRAALALSRGGKT